MMDIRNLNMLLWSFYIVFGLFYLSALVDSHYNPLVSKCPGEGPRYGDFKCIHDRTHRVCAKLISDVDTCQEAKWSGNRSFWDITGQQRWNWKRSVCGGPNP